MSEPATEGPDQNLVDLSESELRHSAETIGLQPSDSYTPPPMAFMKADASQPAADTTPANDEASPTE